MGSRFKIVHRPFGDIAESLREPIAGILLDLGFLSRRHDDACEDSTDSLLSLPSSQLSGISVAQWLETISAAQLAWVIDAFGVLYDPLLSERIAEAILQAQQTQGPF